MALEPIAARWAAPARLFDGLDAARRAIDAAYCHPLSVTALTRLAIKWLQRPAVPASKLACTSAADPQRHSKEDDEIRQVPRPWE